MKISLARDTLELINKVIKQRLLTDNDLAQINSIIIKRLEENNNEEIQS